MFQSRQKNHGNNIPKINVEDITCPKRRQSYNLLSHAAKVLFLAVGISFWLSKTFNYWR